MTNEIELEIYTQKPKKTSFKLIKTVGNYLDLIAISEDDKESVVLSITEDGYLKLCGSIWDTTGLKLNHKHQILIKE